MKMTFEDFSERTLEGGAGNFVWDYSQPWLARTETAFAPGKVWLGRSGGDLLVRANLHDAHVMTDLFPFNAPAFMKCDAFEIFLGPLEEKTYYELHVTPSNSVLQLRFDGEDWGKKKFQGERLVPVPVFSSKTSLVSRGWNVFVRIPLRSLFSDSYAEWQLSFGRYDYTPGEPKPVISSTSPHTACQFHRREEWRRVLVEELPTWNCL